MLLKRKQVAHRLGISNERVARLVGQGHLRQLKIPHVRGFRYAVEDVELVAAKLKQWEGIRG